MCAWIKQKSSMLKGAIISTQLSSDSYDFMNLGYYLERADNIIRFIDVKNFISPINDKEKENNDYQWGILLRTLAAYTQFRLSYGVNMSQDFFTHWKMLKSILKTYPLFITFNLEHSLLQEKLYQNYLI